MIFFRGWAERRQRAEEQRLQASLVQNLSSLFDDYGARFVSNEPYRPGQGTVIATLEAGPLRFKAVSFRDGFYMKVSALHSLSRWETIGNVLVAIDAKRPINSLADVPYLHTYLPLTEIGQLLNRRFPDLVAGLSEANYAATMDAVERIKRLRQEEYDQRAKQEAQFYRDHPEENPWDKKQSIQTLGLK